MTEVTIYGASDDLIEVEYDKYPPEEFNCPGSDLAILESDLGDKISIEYTGGLWKIQVIHLTAWTTVASMITAEDPDSDVYSDVIVLKGPFSEFVVLKEDNDSYEQEKEFVPTPYDLVKKFHAAMGHPINSVDIATATEQFLTLRKRLIMEEAKELCDALDARDLKQILKEANDLDYVTKGALVTLIGIDDPAEGSFLAVHNSNMSKLGDDGKPVYDAGGKVMKGPNYKEPDMTPFIQ